MAEVHGKAGNVLAGGQGCTVSFTASAGGALPAVGSVAVASGGANYAVGNVLNVNGGTGTVTVGTVSATGAILTLSGDTAGTGYVNNGVYTGDGTTLPNVPVQVGMNSWTVKLAQTAAEVTNFADVGVKRFILGESGWSGTFSGNKTGAPLPILNGLFSAVFQESATSTQWWLGQILITDVSSKVDSKNVVQYSYSFTGSGALTLATT